MKKTWRLFFFILLTISYSREIKALYEIWDDFPLVRDKRNFKEGVGGKGIPSQGRILRSAKFLHINKKLLSEYTPTENNWRYVIAMNCRQGDREVTNILAKVVRMVPKEQRQRLAVVLGINERVTAKTPLDYTPTWNDVLGKDEKKALSNFEVPILLVYFQWTSFRESEDDSTLDAQEIRKAILTRISKIKKGSQRERVLDKLHKQDLQHQFPFGEARTFLLENRKTQKFIAALHKEDCSVYVHVQDSDFIAYQEPLLFGNFQGKKPLIPANKNRLLSKFDEVIAHYEAHNRRLPIIVGGAHVYCPEEDLEEYTKKLSIEHLNSLKAKYWTRFASEMGNNIKHIIGQQHPYGLYFHEPNTLVLSPASAERLKRSEKSSEWKIIYKRLAGGFRFGIDSEMQDFTRALFKEADDEVCRNGMVFSSTTVLSTSMKRGKKPFTIVFSGDYDLEKNTFTNAVTADLKTLRGMSQEIISTNDWGSSVATSFNPHKVHDARKFLYLSLRLFDPINLLDPSNKKSFSTALVRYNATIQRNREEIQTLFHNLRGYYNRLHEGDAVALQIITAGWETGQIMRLMFLNHLEPPAKMGALDLEKDDRNIQLFLTKRFNFVFEMINPFVVELLNFNSLIKEPPATLEERIKKETHLTQTQIAKVVKYLYKLNNSNNFKTAQLVDVDPRTVPMLMNDKATRARAWKTVALKLETPKMTRQVFKDLEKKHIKYILNILK
ncbi:MAG: hypothetical protein K2W92_08330 [Alphaproteobacteria bacterium]|nr:hypothetical protein [Alphaproteobacteria bacterium]